jgi:hypothetical protein
MSYTLLNTASTTALTANVISAFGQNIDAVGVIVALAVAIPLVFVVAHYIKGLFRGEDRQKERVEAIMRETKNLIEVDELLG